MPPLLITIIGTVLFLASVSYIVRLRREGGAPVMPRPWLPVLGVSAGGAPAVVGLVALLRPLFEG